MTPEELLVEALKQSKKIVFGNTIGTDSNGNCTVQGKDGSVLARSPDQISAGSAIALKADDGQWYALSARQTGTIAKKTLFKRRNKQVADEQSSKIIVLFKKGNILYVGGDRDEPEKIYELKNGYSFVGSPNINKTGSEKDEYTVNFILQKNSDHNSYLFCSSEGENITEKEINIPINIGDYSFNELGNYCFQNGYFTGIDVATKDDTEYRPPHHPEPSAIPDDACRVTPTSNLTAPSPVPVMKITGYTVYYGFEIGGTIGPSRVRVASLAGIGFDINIHTLFIAGYYGQSGSDPREENAIFYRDVDGQMHLAAASWALFGSEFGSSHITSFELIDCRIYGCTDNNALNYDSNANVETFACTYSPYKLKSLHRSVSKSVLGEDSENSSSVELSYTEPRPRPKERKPAVTSTLSLDYLPNKTFPARQSLRGGYRETVEGSVVDHPIEAYSKDITFIIGSDREVAIIETYDKNGFKFFRGDSDPTTLLANAFTTPEDLFPSGSESNNKSVFSFRSPNLIDNTIYSVTKFPNTDNPNTDNPNKIDSEGVVEVLITSIGSTTSYSFEEIAYRGVTESFRDIFIDASAYLL